VQARVMPQVAGIVVLFAQGAGEEGRAGAGKPPWDIRFHTICPVQAGRRRTFLHILSTVYACPAMRTHTPMRQKRF